LVATTHAWSSRYGGCGNESEVHELRAENDALAASVTPSNLISLEVTKEPALA
jgi:hypothetical protein